MFRVTRRSAESGTACFYRRGRGLETPQAAGEKVAARGPSEEKRLRWGGASARLRELEALRRRRSGQPGSESAEAGGLQPRYLATGIVSTAVLVILVCRRLLHLYKGKK